MSPGEAGADPIEPPRIEPYPQPVPALSPVSGRIAAAARRLGLRPFALPLAIDFSADRQRTCVRCSTCDTYACAIGAKNDVAVTIPARRHENITVLADTCLLAAGALGTPALRLRSGLDRLNPAGQAVGRYLIRHCSSIVMGVFARALDPHPHFHRQIGVHDLSFGDGRGDWPGKLGALQQVGHPPPGLIARALPRSLRGMAEPLSARLTGLLAMAEGQPSPHNRVRVAGDARDAPTVVEHRCSARDLASRQRLVGGSGSDPHRGRCGPCARASVRDLPPTSPELLPCGGTTSPR